VVFGGRGPEHAISCMGAGTVLAFLDRDRYEVVPVGILPDGRWVLTRDEPERLAITGRTLPSVAAVAGPDAAAGTTEVMPVSAPVASVPSVLAGVDVVLPVLHGPFGEDGTIQGLLEMAGVRYVGAGVLASAVGLDKEYMKLVFAARGLPISPYVVVRDRDWQGAPGAGATATAERKRIYDEIDELGYPVFVKPARGGSSIGTAKAADQAAVTEAIEGARRYDTKVIVERAVDGAEIECAVLECQGFARVDFFYTPDGTILANEINTIPGMTATSYFPKMWEATGLPLAQLLDRMITTALRRRPGAY